MKKIMWIISMASLVITAVVLQFMPDKVPMHYDIAGNVDRWGSKYENLIFPGLIILIALSMSLTISYFQRKAERISLDKEKQEALQNKKVLEIVGLVMTSMFFIMQGFILYGAWKGALEEAKTQVVDIGKVSCVLLGAVLIILGYVVPKSKKNKVLGFRTAWTMYNDNTWEKSNRFAGIAMVISGVLTVITGVFMKNSFAATIVSLGYLLLSVIISLFYARRIYLQEKKSAK